MKISQFRQFVTIADTGSMSKAAQQLRISQPALTTSMKQLEEELGQTVFHRSPRGVSLTTYGQSIYKSVVRILDELEVIKPSASPGRPVSICMQSISNLVTELVSEYAEQHPDVRFHITSHTLIDPETEPVRPYHFYVSDHLPDEKNQYNGILLPTRQLYAVVPAAHPLARHEGIQPCELKDEAFVFSSFHDGKNLEPSYYVCIEAGFTPHIAVSTNSIHQKMMLLSTGRFCAFVTGSWLNVYQRFPTIRLIPLTGCAYSMRNISLYYTERALQDRQAADFLAYCLPRLSSAGK